MIAAIFLTMNFFGFKSKKGEVLDHWISFADGFSYPPQDFYTEVEKQLELRRVPGMDLLRVEFSEGSILSGKRIYLRMMRERLVFEACAIPFGTTYVFSCRTVYAPATIKIWHILILIVGFSLIYSGLEKLLGGLFAIVALITLIVAVAQVFQNAGSLDFSDLDALLLDTPVIGPIYERFWRKDTYFRQDTRLAYLALVPQIIKDLASEITGEKGIKLTRQWERAPILGELYKPLPPQAPNT